MDDSNGAAVLQLWMARLAAAVFLVELLGDVERDLPRRGGLRRLLEYGRAL